MKGRKIMRHYYVLAALQGVLVYIACAVLFGLPAGAVLALSLALWQVKAARDMLRADTEQTVAREALFDAASALVWVVDALASSSDGHIVSVRDIALRALRRAQDYLNANT